LRFQQYAAIFGAMILIPHLPPISWQRGFSNANAQAKNNPSTLIDEVWQIVDRDYLFANTQDRTKWQAIRSQYTQTRPKTTEELHETIRSMLKTLNDRFTVFLDPIEFQARRSKFDDLFFGVGLELCRDGETNQIAVVSAIRNTPAFQAGILSQDTIVKIDGQSTLGLDIKKAARLIRGRNGTTVKLTVQRNPGQLLEFKLVRRQTPIRSVEAKAIAKNNSVGYIRLKNFTKGSPAEMSTAIRTLAAQGAKGYILDLRENGGGLISSAISIARMWINEGKLYSDKNRQGQQENYLANRTAITNKPLVVLIDGSSASASEILAGALQDNRRAQLVGSTTFGKGVGQDDYPLANGGGLWVTTFRFYTPNGKAIDKVGIQPDVPVRPTVGQQILINWSINETQVKMTKAQIRAITTDRARVATAADPQYVRAFQALQTKISNPAPSLRKLAVNSAEF
jgi:carboxyl-terminal processing protease